MIGRAFGRVGSGAIFIVVEAVIIVVVVIGRAVERGSGIGRVAIGCGARGIAVAHRVGRRRIPAMRVFGNLSEVTHG